jgi:hypothetical protein
LFCLQQEVAVALVLVSGMRVHPARHVTPAGMQAGGPEGCAASPAAPGADVAKAHREVSQPPAASELPGSWLTPRLPRASRALSSALFMLPGEGAVPMAAASVAWQAG